MAPMTFLQRPHVWLSALGAPPLGDGRAQLRLRPLRQQVVRPPAHDPRPQRLDLRHRRRRAGADLHPGAVRRGVRAGRLPRGGVPALLRPGRVGPDGDGWPPGPAGCRRTSGPGRRSLAAGPGSIRPATSGAGSRRRDGQHRRRRIRDPVSTWSSPIPTRSVRAPRGLGEVLVAGPSVGAGYWVRARRKPPTPSG